MIVKNEYEKNELQNKLTKRNEKMLNQQKATWDKSKEEKMLDKNFIINNLILERDALKNKLEVKIKINLCILILLEGRKQRVPQKFKYKY